MEMNHPDVYPGWLLDYATSSFKDSWAKADKAGHAGSRTRIALEEVFWRLGVDPYEVILRRHAPEDARCAEVEGGGNQCRHWILSEHEHEVEFPVWPGDPTPKPIAFGLSVRPMPLPDGFPDA